MARSRPDKKEHLGQVFGPRLAPEDRHLLDPPKPRPPTGKDAWGRPCQTKRDLELEDLDRVEHRCFLNYFQYIETMTRLFANLRAEAEAKGDMFRVQQCTQRLNEVLAESRATALKLERLAKDVESGKKPGGVGALLEFWAEICEAARKKAESSRAVCVELAREMDDWK